MSEFIPSGYKEVCCDLNISVGILGERPALSQIEIEKVDCPTLFLLGDSTVMDQNTEYPYAPGTSYSGWGQMLPAFVKGKVAIANHGYRENLIRFIEEIREKKTIPILVTPVARNSWRGSEGCYNDLLKDYADCCLLLGKELEVPVIDLHKRSMQFCTGCSWKSYKFECSDLQKASSGNM